MLGVEHWPIGETIIFCDGWGRSKGRAVITGHYSPYSTLIDTGDGRDTIAAVSLLRKVGTMSEEWKSAAQEAGYSGETPEDIIKQIAWDLTKARGEAGGFLAVIDAQMTAIDEVRKEADRADELQKELNDLEDVVNTLALVDDQIGALCDHLGFGYSPVAPTGLTPLDNILNALRP